MKPFRCPLCRKRLVSHQAGLQHAWDSHKVKLQRVEKAPRRVDDDEPSYAELTIEAQERKAAGLPYEAWLLGE